MTLMRLETYWEPQAGLTVPPRQRVRLVFQEADGAERVQFCDASDHMLWQLAGMEATYARLSS
jgi:hypothetical protein